MKGDIRAARADDADAVATIYVASWNEGFRGLMPLREETREQLDRWQRVLLAGPPARWWVAERDSSLVGLVGVCPSRDPVLPDLGEIDTVAVHRSLAEGASAGLSWPSPCINSPPTATRRRSSGPWPAMSRAGRSTNRPVGDSMAEHGTREARCETQASLGSAGATVTGSPSRLSP